MAKNTLQTTNEQDVPKYLQGVNPQDVRHDDNFDNSDVTMPAVRLLQSTSEAIKEHNDAKAGHFWHTGADLDLGEAIRFIVCDRKKRYLLQAPLDDGRGVLARADDARTWNQLGEWDVLLSKQHDIRCKWKIDSLDVALSGLANFGTSNPTNPDSPPAATMFYDYLVILPDHLELGPVVISLARSAIRKAKKGLNDKIAFQAGNGRPLQSLIFEASAITETNAQSQSFYNWSFKQAGFAEEHIYNSALGFSDSFRVEMIPDAPQEDIPTASDDSTDESKGKPRI